MGRLSEVSLGDLVRVGRRYQPVVVSLVVLVATLRLLPGGPEDERDVDPALLARPVPGRQSTVAAVREQAPPAPAVPGGGADAGAWSVEDSDGGYDPVTVDVDGAGVAEGPVADPGGTTTAAAATTEAVPLYVLERTWATAAAGTPIGSAGVPSGTLPVGRRANQDDKRSYVRLAGTTRVLTLSEDGSGRRDAVGQPAVRACQITSSDWRPGEAVSFAQAPAHDEGSCVVGTRAADGTWSFDLSGFADPADRRGIALLPAPGSPVDWQVAFRLA